MMINTFLTIIVLTISSLSLASAPIIGGKIVSKNEAQGVFNIFTTNVAGDLSGSCTASKIGSKYILTAAHCVHGKNIKGIGFNNSETIDLGDEKTTLYGLHIKAVNIHPSYELNNMFGQPHKSSDIAILEIDTTKGNNLKKFQELPSMEIDFTPVLPGENLQTYGYGCENIKEADTLVYNKKVANITSLTYSSLHASCAEIPAAINHSAFSIYEKQMVSSAIANGGNASLCVGDSGGPVVRDGKIVGINSQYIINQASQEEEAYLNLHSRLSEVKNWVAAITK